MVAEKTLPRIQNNKCECGASVANVSMAEHEKSPQHQVWLERVTSPDAPERATDEEIGALPAPLKSALAMLDKKNIRNPNDRARQAAKIVREYYAVEGYSDGVEPPDGLPQTVEGFCRKFGIPCIPGARRMRRSREWDEAHKFDMR